MQTPNDLNDLRLVAAIFDTGSLSGAARRLGVNHATVFRRLQNIEEQLGVRLFEREGGRYTATEAGEELATAGSQIDTLANEYLRKIAGRDLQPSGVVRITTMDAIVGTYLGPVARICRRRHPDIHLEVIMANQMANLTRRDADIALRTAAQPPEDLIARHLGDIHFAVYGARSYLRGKKARSPLGEHDWIAFDESFSQHASLKWLARHLPPEQARVRMNNFPGIVHACVNGLGLAVLPCFLGDRATGLKRVTGTLEDCRRPLWLLTHPDLRNTTRVRAVCDVIQDVMQQHRGELEGKARRKTAAERN